MDDPLDQVLVRDDDGELHNPLLAHRRIAFLGRLGSMNRREAQALVRRLQGTYVAPDDPLVDVIVIGADHWPWDANTMLPAQLQADVAEGHVEVLSETQLWERLGVVEQETLVRRLYTPAMLSDLLGVSVQTIRSWVRRGLIRPVREVHRLPYFDFQEISTAQRLARWLAAGVSPSVIKDQLRQLAELVPGVERPLAQLNIIVQGRELLLQTGGGLIDPAGQRRFEFPEEPSVGDDAEGGGGARHDPAATEPQIYSLARTSAAPPSSREMALAEANDLEEAGHLSAAIAAYRTTLLAGPPSADIQFCLAELLYRVGDHPAARERYYAAIELDHDYVEARANLGCILAEEGEFDLARAAFEGAIERHAEFPDAHFHLARLCDLLDDEPQAEHHWQEFLRLAPDSPWADEARDRLQRPCPLSDPPPR